MTRAAKLTVGLIAAALLCFDLFLVTSFLLHGRRAELMATQEGPYGFEPRIVPFTWPEIFIALLLVLGHGFVVYAYVHGRSRRRA